MNDLLYKVALTKIPLVGAVTAKVLVSYCGGAREVFEAKKQDLLRIPNIGEATAANIIDKKVLEDAEQELRFLDENSIRPIFYLQKDYPQRLRPFNDAPVMLYYRGTADLNHRRTVGIIGTRTPTPQGISICEELVEGLSPYKPLIISGLAYGIDVAAHKKSLEVGLETLGVLGHGLARIYPAQHKRVATEMLAQGGLLTEFASHVGPERENFPMRNRIVAGLCDALIVVETATKGGSIITVQQANGYNRDVFAVPGRVKDKFSQGCNFLIKKNMAMLAENAEDVAALLRWNREDGGPSAKALQASLFDEMTDTEKQVVDLIQSAEEIGVDQLSYASQIAQGDLAALLLNLEFKGVVRSLPGKRYVLC
ncbi:MAG: DNA-processing protein DprA [Saprospiraceae bacterium]|jgi:DNA processing protein|nr:DNA-processing protein DprA [Saprospiraceae bacterium]